MKNEGRDNGSFVPYVLFMYVSIDLFIIQNFTSILLFLTVQLKNSDVTNTQNELLQSNFDYTAFTINKRVKYHQPQEDGLQCVTISVLFGCARGRQQNNK